MLQWIKFESLVDICTSLVGLMPDLNSCLTFLISSPGCGYLQYQFITSLLALLWLIFVWGRQWASPIHSPLRTRYAAPLWFFLIVLGSCIWLGFRLNAGQLDVEQPSSWICTASPRALWCQATDSTFLSLVISHYTNWADLCLLLPCRYLHIYEDDLVQWLGSLLANLCPSEKLAIWLS